MNRKELVNKIKGFYETRETAKKLTDDAKELQPDLVELLQEFDPDGVGVIWNPNDKSKGAAYAQQNSGSDYYDTEAVISWLRKDKTRWMSCSSRVFDLQKFEAEIANGNINKKIVKKFIKTSDAPAPFIRFGKITKESK